MLVESTASQPRTNRSDFQTLQITEERGQNSTGADSGRGRSRNETREQSREHSTSCLPTLRDFCCKRPNAGGPQVGGLESFIVRDEERATPWLPESLRAGLAFRLEHELFGQAAVRIGVEEDLDQYESAFEFAPAPDRYALYRARKYSNFFTNNFFSDEEIANWSYVVQLVM